MSPSFYFLLGTLFGAACCALGLMLGYWFGRRWFGRR